MELRVYQKNAVDRLRAELRSGRKRVILYSPTGSGKTEMAISILKSASEKGKRMMFCANRVELTGQASRRLWKSNLPHGVLQGSNTRDPGNAVLVASIHTMNRRGFPDNVDLIVIDEAHTAPGSKAYRELLSHCRVPVIGLTATPFTRGMGRVCPEIGGPLFESLVPAATIDELIKLGHLVDLDIYAPQEPDLHGMRMKKGSDGFYDYDERQLAERVDRDELVGGIVEHWFKYAQHRRTVVFATNIAHSKHIVTEFEKNGVPAAHIDCYTDDIQRRLILTQLAEGETKVVSNVSVLAEGWDCPAVACMILARPTRSLTRYLQMVGRVLRPHESKDRALLLDHSGSCKRFPYPTTDLPLKLDKGERKDQEKADREIEEKKPRECEKCSFLKPPGVWKCPACGHEPEGKKPGVKVVAGELTRFINGTQAAKQKFWSELQSIGLQRGYSKGRIAHLYRDKFSVWPRGLQDIQLPPTSETLRFIQSRNMAFAKRMSKQKEAA